MTETDKEFILKEVDYRANYYINEGVFPKEKLGLIEGIIKAIIFDTLEYARKTK